MEWMESSPMLCKQGVTGSIPVTSTNFFLIAKDSEKSPRPERSIIRAQCSRTVHETCHAKLAGTGKSFACEF
jgi:hypothetical protein